MAPQLCHRSWTLTIGDVILMDNTRLETIFGCEIIIISLLRRKGKTIPDIDYSIDYGL